MDNSRNDEFIDADVFSGNHQNQRSNDTADVEYYRDVEDHSTANLNTARQ